jgi:hypothetical protein
MSTVYKSTENSKQYAEIESVSSGGVANSMQRLMLSRENTIQKEFMIIVDKDRINTVPMIKAQ